MSQNSVVINETNILKPIVCSCTDCDSSSCFEKRYQASKRCVCNKCKNSKTCLFYSNKTLVESSSDVKVRPDKANINRPDDIDIKKPDEANTKKHDKVYFKKLDNDETNKPDKAAIKKLDKFYIKIDNTKHPISKVKCISQGLETNRLTSYTSSTVDKGLQKEFTKKETYYESGTNTSIHEHMKQSRHTMPKQMTDKTENQVTVVQSMMISHSNIDIDSSTAKLSAQVMDVPYKDFKNSISFSTPYSSKAKLTKYDILQRIRDAYNACSCKVCECIANVSPVKTEACNCKPCECDDCINFKYKLNDTERKIPKNLQNFFDIAFETCNESLIQQKRCNCKPCGCIECYKNIPDPAPCDCKPCECIECHSMAKRKAPIKTVIVAPVEDSHRRYCQCSPCACFECGQVYGAINRNTTHEMSTGISRHTACHCETCLNEACDREGIDACRCDRHNEVMRKPVERDSHDFDIRRATFTKDATQEGEKKKSINNNDRIAMFTGLSQKFPGTEHGCACKNCECVECECKDKIPYASQSLENFGFIKNMQQTPNKSDTCKCAPCEYEICTNREVVEQNRNCKCGVCDCIHCANEIRDFCSNEIVTIALPSKRVSNCKPYESLHHIFWENHQRDMFNKASEKVHPIKTGHLSRLSECKTIESEYDRNFFNENYRKFYENKSISPYSQVRIRNNSKQDIVLYHAFTRHENNYTDSSAKNTSINTKPISLQSRAYINEKDVAANRTKSQADFDFNLQSKNIENVPQSSNSKDCQASESYISALSSCATTSKISYINESGSMSPISLRTHNKSWDGSCNSSGHDHSDYLIQFPGNTIETCINGVMNLNFDRKLNFDRLNMAHNPKNVYPMTGTPYLQCQHTKSCKRRHDSTMNPIPAGQIYYPKVCRNWNVENACECEQCFCDKCSYKKLQFKKCHCKCNSCNCCGVCLKEDLSIFIRKNETTQTRQKVVSDRGQDSAHDETGSKAPCVVTKANIQPDSHELEVSKDEYNLTEKVDPKAFYNSFFNGNNMNDLVKEELCQLGYGYQSLNSYIRNNVDLFDINIYDSVHRTIKEARAFSLELMKILEKYEKANREFESVSQKLKESHKSILDSYNAHNIKNIKENQHLETNDKVKENGNSEKHFNVDKDSNQKRESCSTLGDKNLTIHFNSCDNLIQSVIDNAILTSEDKHEHTNDTTIIVNSHKTVIQKSSITNTKTDFEDAVPINDRNNEKDVDRTINKEAIHIIDHVLQYMDMDTSKSRENRKTYKKYKKLVKRAAVKVRRNSIKNENTSDLSVPSDISQKVLDDIQMNSLSITIKQLKEINDMTEKDYEESNSDPPVKTASKGVVSLMPQVLGSTDLTLGNIKFEIPPEKSFTQNEGPREAGERKRDEESKSWQLMRKNFNLNTMPFNKFQEPKKIPYLEVKVTGALKCISRETGRTFETNEAVAIPYKNKALTKLLAEVIEIRKILQPECNEQLLERIDAENKSDRDQSTSYVDFDTSSMSSSQLQCVMKRKSVGEVSSCSKGTHSMMVQHRVKEAIYMPTLKNFRTRVGYKAASTDASFESSLPSAATSSIETMKVHFQTVRRVSDHTILVKWSAPSVITDVQGYELLVDGRAVKKIFSPARCMAVVTCLPHSEKILLTIRTITSTAAQQGPCPSNSIVYRPRVKWGR